MVYFPLFVELKNKKVLIIGGGNVAYRKLTKLLPFEAEITIVAPKICPRIKELLKNNPELMLEEREFNFEDIKNSFLVISSTNDSSFNKQIAQICKSLNIFVNSVDDKENCSFIFPAIIKKESLVIGCSTSAKAPELAAFVKETIEQNLSNNIRQVVEFLGELRENLKNKVPIQKLRAQIIHKLLEYCQDKNFKITYNELKDEMQKLVEQVLDEENKNRNQRK